MPDSPETAKTASSTRVQWTGPESAIGSARSDAASVLPDMDCGVSVSPKTVKVRGEERDSVSRARLDEAFFRCSSTDCGDRLSRGSEDSAGGEACAVKFAEGMLSAAVRSTDGGLSSKCSQILSSIGRDRSASVSSSGDGAPRSAALAGDTRGSIRSSVQPGTGC